jgi:hypothetical protein
LAKIHSAESDILISDDEIKWSFQLPHQLELWPVLPTATIAPEGMVAHGSIDEFGQLLLKYRANFDQSFLTPHKPASQQVCTNIALHLASLDYVSKTSCIILSSFASVTQTHT